MKIKMLTKKIKSIPLGMLIWMASISIGFVISGNAYGSLIQSQPPQVIFAANCATCHGSTGQGGVSWVKDSPYDTRPAPSLVGKPAAFIMEVVREGSVTGAMPAFGVEEITYSELVALANMLYTTNPTTYPNGLTVNNGGVPAIPPSVVTLNILDADPWYSDGGISDDPANDVRRVALGATDTLKVVNTGRTWHTLTDSKNGKDSGFIGYAGNYRNNPGDLGDIGYYYAEQGADLTAGCHRYLCKLHPYMQVEVCTDGNLPHGPTSAGTSPVPYGGLTRAHKHTKGLPPVPGVGEIWVAAQSQEAYGEDTTTVVNKSVVGMDGAYQVINAGPDPVGDTTVWEAISTPGLVNVGNNPHNAWPGKNAAGADVVLSADWHDNTVTLMSAGPMGGSNKQVLGKRRSGTATAHIQTAPTDPSHFYVTHMGGRAVQQIDVDALTLGYDPNVGGLLRGGSAPHGLWFCDNGNQILTANTTAGSATLYNTVLKTSQTASSGGSLPLAPALFSTSTSNDCYRGFTNNAGSADISVYDLNKAAIGSISRNTAWDANNPNGLYKNAAGNIQLRNITNDQVASGPFQARWVHLPVQTPVSPEDATTHDRYMVTANKASFNVSVTALNGDGNPTATYTFPAGLGAHGVTYGKKYSCDVNNNGVIDGGEVGNGIAPGTEICYYAYVTNTFEDYISVYDLEQIEIPVGNGGMGLPGSAITAETVYVEGGAVEAVVALDPVVASLCDALTNNIANADPVSGTTDNLDGAMDSVLLVRPGLWLDGLAAPNDAIGDVLDCGVGVMSGAGGTPTPVSLFVNNLPIGVLCPDCRAGVHVGDIPLTPTAGQGALAYDANSTSATLLDNTNNVINVLPIGTALTSDGSTSKYTYLKEEVYVDTETIACVLGYTTLPANDCNGDVPYGMTGRTTGVDGAGKLNLIVELDLELGINTGGQGIVVRSPAAPW